MVRNFPNPDDIPCWICAINVAQEVRIVNGKGYDLCRKHTKWFDEMDLVIEQIVTGTFDNLENVVYE